MAKKFESGSASVQNVIARMKADDSFTVGSDVNDLSTVANVNFEEMTLSPGMVIAFPDEDSIKENRFQQKIPGTTNLNYGVICQVVGGDETGSAKRVSYSALRRRVVKYGENLKPVISGGVAQAVHSDNELYTKAVNAPTIGAIEKLVVGKCYKIEHAPGSPVQGPVYQNRQVVDVRQQNVWKFTEVEEQADGSWKAV